MTHCDEGAWRLAGFDDDFATYCTVHGWRLADVECVLCGDAVSEWPLDWCYSGLDPLEALAAISVGADCPSSARLSRLEAKTPLVATPTPTHDAEANEA